MQVNNQARCSIFTLSNNNIYPILAELLPVEYSVNLGVTSRYFRDEYLNQGYVQAKVEEKEFMILVKRISKTLDLPKSVQRGLVTDIVAAIKRLPIRQLNDALFRAVKSKDEPAIPFLISVGARYDSYNSFGQTPLQIAIKQNNFSLVQKLAPLDSQDEYGNTPLHYAVQYGLMGLLQKLIEAGACPDIRNRKGQTAVDLTALYQRFAMMDELDSVRGTACRQEFARAHYVDNVPYPLHAAIKAGSIAEADLLIEQGVPLDVKDEHGHTSLHLAIESGHMDIVDILLKYKAPLDMKDREDNTPLHLAIKYGYMGIVELLLMHNAPPDAKDREDNTPLHLVIRRGAYTSIVELLLMHNAPPDAKGREGNTPLHLAIESGYMDIVEILLKYNAPFNVENERGDTPIHLAARRRNVDLIKRMIEQDALFNEDRAHQLLNEVRGGIERLRVMEIICKRLGKARQNPIMSAVDTQSYDDTHTYRDMKAHLPKAKQRTCWIS